MEIPIESNINGLSFGTPIFKATEGCLFVEDYLVKIALLLTFREKGRGEFKKAFGKCFNKIPKDVEQIAFFPYLGNLTGVKTYLRDSQISFQKRLKIQSFYKQSLKISKDKSIIIDLLTYGVDDKRFKDEFSQLKYKEKVDELSIDFWKKLFSLNLALSSNNTPWLSQLVEELSQTSPYLFLITGINFDKNERNMVRDYILELLDKVKKLEIIKERGKILSRKISQLGKTKQFKEIGKQLDAHWSLTELRSRFSNALWRDDYFDFWYSLIVDRTSQAEVDSKLRKVLSPSFVSRMPFSQMWIFENYLPASEDVRKNLYDRLKKKWEKGNLLESYQVLKILKMAPVKASLSKEVKDLRRASFQLSREFYIRILNSGHSIEFAIYQLYLLGDKQSDHLWWLIL